VGTDRNLFLKKRASTVGRRILQEHKDSVGKIRSGPDRSRTKELWMKRGKPDLNLL